jgi:hypothetical protein
MFSLEATILELLVLLEVALILSMGIGMDQTQQLQPFLQLLLQ